MKDVLKELKAGRRFFLATHLNPDGDALGSALAMAEALDAIGKEVRVFDLDGVPEIYRFMPGWERVESSLDRDEGKDAVLVLLDCNNLDRAGLRGYNFGSSIVIDHHKTASAYGDTRWVEPSIAATGMMVHAIIEKLGLKLTSSMATNLYTALAIDTGTFRFSNSTAEVFDVASRLVRAGAKPGMIADKLYQNWNKGRFRLHGLNMASMEIKGEVAFTEVTLDMLKKTRCKPEDAENFVNSPLVMSDVKVSVMLKEISEEHWKASLRSKGEVDVSEVAMLFKGGGHMNAAGCTLRGSLKEVKRKLTSALKEVL